MKEKLSKILFCTFVLLTVLAATPPAAISTTTIEFWQFWTDSKVRPTILAMVNDFEEQNPDIKVNLTDLTWANGHEKIVIAFVSNTAPDVLELGSDWVAQFAASGHLADISDLVAADSENFHGWGMATYESKVYGWPWILGTRVIFFNRDLMNRAGYVSSYVPVTLPELKEVAVKIDELGPNIYGWGSNTAEKHRLYKKFLPFFWTAGGQIFSDDGKYCVIASDYAVSALKLYKELHDCCGYVANQRGIEDAFLEGKIGFIFSGDWLLKRIELEKRELNFGTSLMPGNKFPGRSFLGGEILCVNSASKNKEAALKFIKFLNSAENQTRFCKANRSSTPSGKLALTDDYFSSNDHLQTFNRQILMSDHPPVDPDWVEIEDIIESTLEEVLFNEEAEPAEALRKARHKIEALKNK